jgi:hypothetical protein
MEYQEYPKALYRNGDYLAVQDADEEAAAREDGYAGWHEDQLDIDQARELSQAHTGEPDSSPPRGKPGPKPKAK